MSSADTAAALAAAARSTYATCDNSLLAAVSAIATAMSDLSSGDLSSVSSLQIGNNLYFTVTSAGDVWLTINAKYDGANWQRINVATYAFALVFLSYSSIPGEEAFGGNSGLMFLRAIPAANPISSTFWSFGGWENSLIIDQFRHLVVGGQGIEVDGAGTFPYGRFVHNGSPTRTGILSNLFLDYSGVDDNTNPSWFIGRKGDGYIIERAQAGSTSLSQLYAIGNTGILTENAATYSGAGSPGTGLLAAVNLVTSVAGGSNVQLATASNPGTKQVVVNGTSSVVVVNPPTSGAINGAATYNLAANTQASFYALDSNHYYAGSVQPTFPVQRVTSNITAVNYPGGVTTEQDLQTYSLPAGTLGTDGQAIRITAAGTFALHASATRTVKLYFGATQLGLYQAGSGGPFNWIASATVWRTGATTQYSVGQVISGTNNVSGTTQQTIASPAETLSGAVTIKTTGQTTLAQAADVVSNIITVELL